MPYTRKKLDLESVVIERCVKALKLEGESGARRKYRTCLDSDAKARVLRYLADRFGVKARLQQ